MLWNDPFIPSIAVLVRMQTSCSVSLYHINLTLKTAIPAALNCLLWIWIKSNVYPTSASSFWCIMLCFKLSDCIIPVLCVSWVWSRTSIYITDELTAYFQAVCVCVCVTTSPDHNVQLHHRIKCRNLETDGPTAWRTSDAHHPEGHFHALIYLCRNVLDNNRTIC